MENAANCGLGCGRMGDWQGEEQERQKRGRSEPLHVVYDNVRAGQQSKKHNMSVSYSVHDGVLG